MAMNYHRGDPVLYQRALRAASNLIENGATGALDRACEQGEPLILGMADGTQRKVTVKSTSSYGFELDDGEHHKLEVLYAIPPKSAKNLKKVAKRDASVAALGLKPAVKVRDRPWISKMVLQKIIDEGSRARFTLTDGTIIPIRLRTFGLYELDGDIKGAAITIFRHAIFRLEVGEERLAEHSAA
jgi:hypothetical protein